MAAPSSDCLDPRSEAVLKTLIETHLLDGEPVGSRVLSKRYVEALSPATIRNVLADLEEDHWVIQPHTSAGRIPTEKAYRYYIKHFVHPTEPEPAVSAKLAKTLEGLELDPEAWIRHTTRVLAELMKGLVLALPLRLQRLRLMRLEFLPLPSGRLVAVWVGPGGEVEYRHFENSWSFDANTLQELGNFASEQFQGLTLPEIRQRILQSLRSASQEAHLFHHRLNEIMTRWPEMPSEEAAPLSVSGLGYLGEAPEFKDILHFRQLLATFEEHEHLIRLLNAFAEAASLETQLVLGSENPYLRDMPLATAVRTVPLGICGFATFAFVSPLRTDYSRLLGELRWWSDHIQRRTQTLQTGHAL